jgi:ATP-binding cassette subfamily B multidrug efflux pump
MDKLVVLDRGKIVEQGSHEALLALGGIYAGLWAHQSGGFLPDRLIFDGDEIEKRTAAQAE